MNEPVQITFRDMDPSEAIASVIREKATKLRSRHPRMLDCHVVVRTPHRRHHKGRHHHIRVTAKVPGHEAAVDRDPPRAEHEDVYVAIRDAFEAIRKQLDAYEQTRKHR